MSEPYVIRYFRDGRLHSFAGEEDGTPVRYEAATSFGSVDRFPSIARAVSWAHDAGPGFLGSDHMEIVRLSEALKSASPEPAGLPEDGLLLASDEALLAEAVRRGLVPASFLRSALHEEDSPCGSAAFMARATGVIREAD